MARVLTSETRNRLIIVSGLAGLFAFYVLGLDQGYLLSVVQGSAAFDMNLIHELLHDARHAAGFPCH